MTADAVARRAEQYRPQMSVYARAVSRLWKRPVRRCSLVFLAPKVIHVVTEPELGR